MNPSSSGHRGDDAIAYRVLVRSGHGVERFDQPAEAAERPFAGRRYAAIIEDVPADALLREEDDALQWFVDLFVADLMQTQPAP